MVNWHLPISLTQQGVSERWCGLGSAGSSGEFVITRVFIYWRQLPLVQTGTAAGSTGESAILKRERERLVTITDMGASEAISSGQWEKKLVIYWRNLKFELCLTFLRYQTCRITMREKVASRKSEGKLMSRQKVSEIFLDVRTWGGIMREKNQTSLVWMSHH